MHRSEPNPEPSALAGLRVLDLSTRLSGAFCARLLADFGADVLLAEPPDGHPLRHEPPFAHDKAGPDASLVHAYCNANKRAVLLAAEDTELRARLVEWADVVVTSEPRDATELAKFVEHGTVLTSITPHGLGTEHSDRPGLDLTAAATSGWASIGGLQGEAPLKGPPHQVGYLAGLNAFVGTLGAIIAHERDHGGELVDVSELETLALIVGPSVVNGIYDGSTRRRADGSVFGSPVPVKDGHVSVTFSRAHFWRDAMNVLGLPELAEDPRYVDSRRRRAHLEYLRPLIEERLMEQSRWEVFDLLTVVRCVAGVVLDMEDIDRNEHLASRGFFVETGVSGIPASMPGAPFLMSVTPWRQHRPAPAMPEASA